MESISARCANCPVYAKMPPDMGRQMMKHECFGLLSDLLAGLPAIGPT